MPTTKIIITDKTHTLYDWRCQNKYYLNSPSCLLLQDFETKLKNLITPKLNSHSKFRSFVYHYTFAFCLAISWTFYIKYVFKYRVLKLWLHVFFGYIGMPKQYPRFILFVCTSVPNCIAVSTVLPCIKYLNWWSFKQLNSSLGN